MAMTMFVFALLISQWLYFSKCVAFRGRELSSRTVSLDTNCYGELNTLLKRENDALVKLQKCTEENCELSDNQKRERCTENAGYKFDSEMDMCYKLYTTLTVCRDAIKGCADDNGRLATLNSPKKESYFIDYMKQHHSSVAGLLAGGHYDQRDGAWRWEDGSKIAQLNWGPSEPHAKNECLGIRKSVGYKWCDWSPDDKTTYFLCELQL